MTSRSVRLVLAALAVVVVLPACANGTEPRAEASEGQAADADAPTWLFVVPSLSARIATDDSGTRLTMSELHDVIMFTDRPQRMAKRVTPEAM